VHSSSTAKTSGSRTQPSRSDRVRLHPQLIDSGGGLSTSSAAIIAAGCIGICSIILALITVYVVRSR
jgi:hypothetical protein